MSSPLAPTGMVGWCMCRAQLIPAVISSKRKFVMGKNTGSSWFTTELISASQPQIFGNPDLNSSRTGRLGDDTVAVIRLSFIVAVLALTFNSDLRWRSLGAGERIDYNRASACGHLIAEFLQFKRKTIHLCHESLPRLEDRLYCPNLRKGPLALNFL